MSLSPRFLFCWLLLLPLRALAITALPYLPLDDGNSWTYQINTTQANRYVAAGSYPVNGVATKLLKYANGDEAYLTNDSNGIRKHKQYVASYYLSGVGYVSETDVFSPPLKFANAEMNVGDVLSQSGKLQATLNAGNGQSLQFTLDYSGSSQVLGYESVVTPAGTFNNALKIKGSITYSGYANGQYLSGSTTEVYWTIPNIGVVRNDTTTNGNTSSALLHSSNLTTPLVGFSPASLTFPAQRFNTSSASQTITLTNKYASAIQISGLQLSGSFSQSNNCQSGLLAAGASCSVQVSYTALGSGSQTGTLTITTSASKVPLQIALSGTTTYPLNLSMTGQGSVSSSPSGLACNASCTADFNADTLVSLTPQPEPGYLFTGWSGDCFGQVNCSLSMSAARNVGASFTLATPLPGLSYAAMTFGDQKLGTVGKALSLSLANSGLAALQISGISASGDFSVSHDCGSSLAPKAFCEILVSFAPSASGDRSGTLSVFSNAAGSPHKVSLSGRGVLQVSADLAPGWNLLGNGTTEAIPIGQFADPEKVTSVWKWLPAQANWAFYAPGLPNGGADYASGKGYQLLSSIAPGEGFWVNAKSAFTTSFSGISPFLLDQFGAGKAQELPKGWSLIAVGNGSSPRAFTNALASDPPSPGTPAASSLISLWAWHAGSPAQAPGWLFYAPSLDNNGGLDSYRNGKGYLGFEQLGRTLDPASG
ncbi:MAG: hypothetical protein RIR00_436, partial [Pseudomonadota bacterium]